MMHSLTCKTQYMAHVKCDCDFPAQQKEPPMADTLTDALQFPTELLLAISTPQAHEALAELVDNFHSHALALKDELTAALAESAKWKAEATAIIDQLQNGVRYSEEHNCYLLTWTPKQLEVARKCGKELAKKLANSTNQPIAPGKERSHE